LITVAFMPHLHRSHHDHGTDRTGEHRRGDAAERQGGGSVSAVRGLSPGTIRPAGGGHAPVPHDRPPGLVCLVAFEKHCTNYRFTARGRDMLATVVRVPELDGTFIEVETMTDQNDTEAALADVRAILGQLGIAADDLTTEQYTEAVLTARQ
jgi:hypothetical protein